MEAQRPEVAAAACATGGEPATRNTEAIAAPALGTPSTIAIVGTGQAGGWAAHTLRQEGFAGRIVIVGDEPHPPHERPPLSKAVLAGDAAPRSTWLFKPEAWDALNLDWRAGVSAVRIDRDAHRLVLSDGAEILYDKLILCTGGRARTLPATDVDVRTLRTIEDAQALAPLLTAGRRLVVIGGGWIGLEVAATARRRGAEVTVIESQSRLCERSVPGDISEHLLALHRREGVQVLLGAKLARVERVARVERPADDDIVIGLEDGRTLACDIVVAGIGLIPNDQLARDAGLVCEGGIVVDAACRSSDPDILAAGDVAVASNPWAGRRMRLESWQNAQEQGMAAARSALGLAVDYAPLPWFWSDQYDANLQIYGVPRSEHRVVMRGDPAAGSFALLYLAGEIVQAALGVNAAKDLRFARRLIEQRRPVDATRLADNAMPMSKI